MGILLRSRPGPLAGGVDCHMGGRARRLLAPAARAWGAAGAQGRRQKKPQVLRPGVCKGGPSMKGRKSARGYSVQSRPVQDPDVLAVQVEALRQQSAQLTVGARVAQRLAQLDNATPFAAAGGALSPAAGGDEMGVVLGSHGLQVSSAAWRSSVKCSTEPPISVNRECDIIHR